MVMIKSLHVITNSTASNDSKYHWLPPLNLECYEKKNDSRNRQQQYLLIKQG